jgi:hypothetical protein
VVCVSDTLPRRLRPGLDVDTRKTCILIVTAIRLMAQESSGAYLAVVAQADRRAHRAWDAHHALLAPAKGPWFICSVPK